MVRSTSRGGTALPSKSSLRECHQPRPTVVAAVTDTVLFPARRHKSEGRLRFRKRPSYFDGDKPNSVGVIAHADDHLSHPSRNRGTRARSRRRGTVMRRYPRIFSGPAVLPLFCLAPHGVFPASRIAPRAVSSYLAFSPLPVPLLPKNRRCLFCDTFRRHDFTIAAPSLSTRHVAVWCSDFPPASVAAYQRSPAITVNLTQSGTQESRNKTSP
jgi:hypothetical protein